jgi:hypothetical protein
MPNDPPKAPTGLRAPGRRLWTSIVGPYVLTPGELVTLEQAARSADLVDRLERDVRALPELTSVGYAGQPRPHPLLNALRSERLLLERLVAGLHLPDEDHETGAAGNGSLIMSDPTSATTSTSRASIC